MTNSVVVGTSVSFLIHMGAALIKSSISAIHATGCLALNKKKKRKKKTLGVLSGNMTNPAGRAVHAVMH